MKERTTTDLVVLILTVTVCGVVVLVAVAVTVAGTIPPNDPLAGRYVDLLMTAAGVGLGALLGLLAGRKASAHDTQVRPPR
jgi:uncharacterized metal-binding protein